jgi:hypothetical protein
MSAEAGAAAAVAAGASAGWLDDADRGGEVSDRFPHPASRAAMPNTVTNRIAMI